MFGLFHKLGRRTTALATRQPTSPVLPASPSLDVPPPFPGATAAEIGRVRAIWTAYARDTPALTPAEFLQKLQDRHRLFAEERAEREAKLAKLRVSLKPLP